ncbi:S-adenosyl-L-methionine-dependent methyltransferase [Aspergillus heteromorphus CBS 117.55]|uniref:S-adenosyl-L-methionine-dependent methyltransferase n=1 Tax=Aspergillus heteromorphus CBS 117.55 TaxID=1448321 RepID=A0A317WLU6_9EURO|nr:S-adenosyl-L-methionine-dependent methyltransferase [Aspergillus heteromorphus CBS 117.55]PWY87005.1 S-adenosyl-L-methionine-dependent methyltransferase [Aspergillus heteromorphus CBS 117.55]
MHKPPSISIRPLIQTIHQTPIHPININININTITTPKPRLSHATPTTPTRNMSTQTWNATQYLKFASERTLPARDLLTRVLSLQEQQQQHHHHHHSPLRITDLGCGPGNSTAVLAAQFPQAQITGLDSSAAMIQQAQTTGTPRITFSQADISTYTPPRSSPTDLFFSNAVLHWLPRAARIETIRRLMATQPSGGMFAFQVPDNLEEMSHVKMREVAALEGRTPREIHERLVGTGGEDGVVERVEIWRTEYWHSLRDHAAIVEWVKGSGLRPFLDALGEGEDGDRMREAFLEEYERRLKEVYPVQRDGRVLLGYPRLFVVAVRR